MTKVFFCAETRKVRRSLRRFASGPCGNGGEYSYHNANVVIDESDDISASSGDLWPHDDPRWPTACEACGRSFVDADDWQLFHESLYVRNDTGRIGTWREMPVGAVRDLKWMHDRPEYVGPDGRSLECRTPGGDWIIDSRANNCGSPGDQVHKCWVRHGRPEDGNLHVDKNGNTCSAGAGSIATKTWHGFLHGGALVSA